MLKKSQIELKVAGNSFQHFSRFWWVITRLFINWCYLYNPGIIGELVLPWQQYDLLKTPLLLALIVINPKMSSENSIIDH